MATRPLRKSAANWSNIPKALVQQVFGPKVPATVPKQPVAVLDSHGEAFLTPPSSGLRITWFGHSSALVEVDERKLLIDPFWGERVSPLSWWDQNAGTLLPSPLRELPEIDAVLICHDHYDHLDFGTVAAMRPGKPCSSCRWAWGHSYKSGASRRIASLNWIGGRRRNSGR